MDEKELQQLRKELNELKAKVAIIDKHTIKIAGPYATTTVPVTINGIRRKITHSAP